MSCTMRTRLRHSPFVWLLGLLLLRVGLLALGINRYLIFGAARLARLHVGAAVIICEGNVTDDSGVLQRRAPGRRRASPDTV